jgi:hypothetical protein
MKSFRDYIQEVEGPRSELDKLVVKEHPVKVTDYPVKDDGQAVKTKKDKTRAADQQGGKGVKAYAADNGVKTDPMSEVPVFQSGRAYSKQQIMQYFKPEARSYDEVKAGYIDDLNTIAAEIDSLAAELTKYSKEKNSWVDQYSVKALVRQLQDFRDELNCQVNNAKPPEALKLKEGLELLELSQERLKDYQGKAKDSHRKNLKWTSFSAAARKKNDKRVLGLVNAWKRIKEEVEEIDEVSRERLKAYVAASNKDANKHDAKAGEELANSDSLRALKHLAKVAKRVNGIARAQGKLKESFASVQKKISSSEHLPMKNAGAILASASRNASAEAKRKNPKLKRVKEEFEEAVTLTLDEVSKQRLGAYIKKAKDDHAQRWIDIKGFKGGKVHKIANRSKGIDKAVDKLTKEDVNGTAPAPADGGSPEGRKRIKKNKEKLSGVSFREFAESFKERVPKQLPRRPKGTKEEEARK